MDNPFELRLARSWPPEAWRDVCVLLAVSGGADSVALLRAMTAIAREAPGAGKLIVAHLNHSLRGDASDQDERFVVETCRELNIPCEVGKADVGETARQAGDGLEAAARNARYQFLQQTAEKLGARYVATAHTADDQAETVLHRIVRGSGIAGLAGIPRSRALGPAVTLIRPMLDLRRSDVEAYLASIDQPFRIDTSNRDPRFTRNRIRHDLLPQIRESYNPQVTDALLRLSTTAGEAQAVIESLVERLAEQSVKTLESGVISLDSCALARQPRYLVRELMKNIWRGAGWPLQAMGFAEWDRLATIVLETAGESRLTMPGGITVTRCDGRVTLLSPE